MNAKTISVFSNKGGVGKTFVAANLAAAIAMTDKKVLLLDLDLSGGQDMARMLNLAPRNTIADIISQLSLENKENIVAEYSSKHSSGMDFYPAIDNTLQIKRITPQNIKIFLKKAQAVYDYIIIDAGKDYSETHISVFDYSNLILLIATPDILSVSQIRRCLELLQGMQFPLKMIKLILNRSESSGSVAWQEVRAALACEILAHIPSDGKAVGMSLNKGVLCIVDSPKSKIAPAFHRMVSMLKKDEMFVESTELEKQRSNASQVGGPDFSKFWEDFGISQQMLGVHREDGTVMKVEDEIITLKKKIHEKLVERLNQEGITVEALSDPQTVKAVKKKAEEIVGDLLVEESGGKLASVEERVRLVKEIIDEALGLGPLEDYLSDPEVTDIMVNSREQMYVEKKGKLVLTNKKFVSDQKMRSIIDRIIAPLGRRIDESTPMVDARLPDGSRFNAIIPPLSLNGPMITIRKFGEERLGLEDLIHRHSSINQDMANFLKAAITCRKNIIVSGGTGSGKTTLLNVISEFIPDGERILTIEDAAELRLKKLHWARLESRPRNIEGKGEVTIRDLFTNSLRMRPDRIIIGECRGPEVLDMLQAMNTGHDGSLTTLHANSTRDVLTRLHSMILLSGIELPVRAINEMIASAIDLIVHVNRFSDGTRKCTAISEIKGLTEDHQVDLVDVFAFKQEGIDENGKVLGGYKPTGYIPEAFEDFVTRGIKFDKNVFLSK